MMWRAISARPYAAAVAVAAGVGSRVTRRGVLNGWLEAFEEGVDVLVLVCQAFATRGQGLTLAHLKAQLDDFSEHIAHVRAQLEHLRDTSTGYFGSQGDKVSLS